MSHESAAQETALPEELTFRDWQDALREGRILGHRCDNCGRVTSFPRAGCDHCGSRSLTVTELPTTGEVYSVTRVHVAPEGFDGGYGLALVDVGEARVLGRIDGAAEIGDPVTFDDVFEGSGDPAPVFTPDD